MCRHSFARLQDGWLEFESVAQQGDSVAWSNKECSLKRLVSPRLCSCCCLLQYALNKSTQILPMPPRDCFLQAASADADWQPHSLLGNITPRGKVDISVHLEEVENSIVDSPRKKFGVVWSDMLKPVVAHKLNAN